MPIAAIMVRLRADITTTVIDRGIATVGRILSALTPVVGTILMYGTIFLSLTYNR